MTIKGKTANLVIKMMFLVTTLTDEMTVEKEDVLVKNPAYSPTLEAYYCEENANGLSSAKFSLNTPQECNITDGSIYLSPPSASTSSTTPEADQDPSNGHKLPC